MCESLHDPPRTRGFRGRQTACQAGRSGQANAGRVQETLRLPRRHQVNSSKSQRKKRREFYLSVFFWQITATSAQRELAGRVAPARPYHKGATCLANSSLLTQQS